MRAVIGITVCLLASVPATGQSVGANVDGIVSDPSGGVLRDASVTILHATNGRAITLATGAAGEYRAVALIPGEYDLVARHDGFASVSRRVALTVGAQATVNFVLPLATVTQQVEAILPLSLVEVARSQPRSVVTRAQVSSLPVLERNFLVLAQLLPGSGPINSTVGRFAVTKFGGPADQRSGFTTLIDGGDIDDAQWGSPTINVGQDAVQEFTVFRNQFDAQYGHALNAVVSVVTRSGTNRPSGTGFYFGRDRALNARNAFATTKLPFDEQRVGGTFGGPIVRDRTHVFGAFERDNIDTVRIIALPAVNPFASENGAFPATARSRMASARLDHRLNATQAVSLRHATDDQVSLRAQTGILSDTSQVDIRNRSHSTVIEHVWTPSQDIAHALRVHLLTHRLGTTARSRDVGIRRPSGTIGQTNNDAQVLARTRVVASNVLYRHTARHDLKLGGELALASHDNDSRVFEFGLFEFQTDAPFDPAVRATWPTAFSQQATSLVTYRSTEIGAFVQDDWRIGDRVRLNAGLRYDVDLNLRLNDFYESVLRDPLWSGLDRFVTPHRGTDTNNLQPRVGATWDPRGTGRMVVRGGWGVYVARNRPWFQLRSMTQFAAKPIRIIDPERLKLFPDASAVLGGTSLDAVFAASGPRQLGTVIPDDFVQPYALNTTVGFGWQLNAVTALDVDYVHSSAARQVGATDRNLPASGPITGANSVPRPVPTLGQVLTLENYSESWYDALETQLRSRFGDRGSVQASYTFSRSYLDGVDFFVTTRGTQRTPHERGYNPSDQRHNLTVAASVTVPWAVEVSSILKLVSGSPIKVQAGFDLDGDTIVTGDLPAGIPITVGRERVDESLLNINALRASRNLPPVSPALLTLDPYRTLDLRVSRGWSMRHGQRVEVLLEAFNVTNHVNFRPPLGSINSSAFLIRTVARDPRQLQWGVRYTF